MTYFGSGVLGSSWLSLSRRVRRWLTLRLYRRKIVYRDGIPYLTERLTAANKALIFILHLFVLGGTASLILAGFFGFVRLVYG